MLEWLRIDARAMTRPLAFLVLLLAAAAAPAAQLYRWVDEQGRVEWRDTPPPASAKDVQQVNVPSGAAPAPAVPYAVQQAVRNFPVTLWNSNCGSPCDRARALLASRAIPHTEKDAKANLEEFRKVTGGLDVPVLIVGHDLLKGYNETDWNNALDAAGYPHGAAPGQQ